MKCELEAIKDRMDTAEKAIHETDLENDQLKTKPQIKKRKKKKDREDREWT